MTSGSEKAAPERRGQTAVGYLLTHYPRLAQTFIAGEIAELEKLGTRVVPISLNPCDDGSPAEQARTYYVKATPKATILRVVLRVASRHPVGLARLCVTALRTGGTDMRALVWRLFYVLEGMLAWHHCRANGVRHVHAHFGQTPASVAWFTAEVGRLMDGSPWTWGFTIHGFQDFVNERDARLDLKAADAAYVVCVSDFTRSQLMRVSAPEHWSKFHVVRCGIDLRQFAFRAPGALPAQPTISVVARVSTEKGHLVLLRALRDLHTRGNDARLQIIGSGDFLAAVEAYAAELGLSGAVEFTGELSPDVVLDRLRAADVFCLPSFAEGLPVSIMEAMALGVPVVSTYISGIPELAVHDRTALVVPAGNSSELADALAMLLTDEATGKRLARAARDEVEAHHDIVANVAELATVFREHGALGGDHG